MEISRNGGSDTDGAAGRSHGYWPDPPTVEVVLDSGGWLSGPGLDAKHRRLARDIRSDIIGEVMAEPFPGSRNFWLRRVGGGTEWEVPRQFMQRLDSTEAAA